MTEAEGQQKVALRERSFLEKFVDFCNRIRSSEVLIIIILTVSSSYESIMDYALTPLLPRKLTEMFSRSSNVTETELNHQVNTHIGILFAMRPLGAVLFGFVSGYIVDRFDHKIGFILGSIVCFTAIFIFGSIDGFWIMAGIRFVQGCGAILTLTAAFALVPCMSDDPIVRSRANLAISFGSDIGVGFGGFISGPLYELFGWTGTFIAIGFIGVFDMLMRMIIKVSKQPLEQTCVEKENIRPKDVLRVLTDPLMIAACVFAFVQNSLYSFHEITMPAWSIRKFGIKPWELSLLLGIGGTIHLIAQVIYLVVTKRINKYHYLVAASGPILTACGLYFYPLFSTIWILWLPVTAARVASVCHYSALLPLLSDMSQWRHGGRYGMVCSTLHISTKGGILFGGITAGVIVSWLTMEWSCVVFASIVLCCTPLGLMFGRLPSQRHIIPCCD